jgi:hypothetical protein
MRCGIERGAGDRHDLAPRLARQPRGDQRAGLRRGLDHQRAAGEAGDDAVARWEMAPARLGAGGLFGDQQAFARDPLLQARVLRGIGDVDPAGDHADGAGKRAACAAPSIPRARPETTVKPASASAARNRAPA